MSVVLSLALVVTLVLLVGRYGADSRTGADPTGRDPAWSGAPTRAHTLRADLRALGSLTRAWAAQVRAHEVLARHERPWEPCTGDAALTPRC